MTLKIAHFIETEVPGGAESMLVSLARYSQHCGYQPVIIHFDHPYFQKQCQQHNIPSLSAPDHQSFKSIKTLWKFALSFSRFLKEQKIDILHSHLFGPITGAALAARLAGIPHIGTLHDIYMIEEAPYRIRMVQMAALCGTQLVSVCKNMETFYRTHAYFSKQALCTIYNGVEQPESNIDRLTIRQSLGINSEDIVIIAVGRLVPIKRYQLLIDAFTTIKDDRVKLIIVGEGPEADALRNQTAKLQCSQRIIFTGARQDINELLNASDIFTQCSDSEGLSMSIIEALASALPCVVTSVGGNSELVEEQANGYLVPAGSIELLADRLSSLCQSQSLRQQFAEYSKALWQEKFHRIDNFKHYHHLYQRLSATANQQDTL